MGVEWGGDVSLHGPGPGPALGSVLLVRGPRGGGRAITLIGMCPCEGSPMKMLEFDVGFVGRVRSCRGQG